jgi:hypothetical protein
VKTKYFELYEDTGFRLKAARVGTQVYVGVPKEEAKSFILVAGCHKGTSAFFRTGQIYYFNLEIFRGLFPQKLDLWNHLEEQSEIVT